MTDPEQVRAWALALPEAEEHPHFERASFRVKKKIFATLGGGFAVLKLSPEEQSVFGEAGEAAVSPVPGGWGRQGYTRFFLAHVHPDLLRDAMRISYRLTAPKKLADLVGDDYDLG